MAALLCFSYSCEKEVETWSGADRINFVTDKKTEHKPEQAYSFVFEPQTTTRHTVWFDVETQGDVCDYPRQVTLVQIPSDGTNGAVAGTDYVSFDDAEMRELLVVPAGQTKASIPVILLRSAALQNGEKELKFTFAANDHFQPGFETHSIRTLTFSDFLSQPAQWTNYMSNFFGSYGVVKHRFMADITGEAIDDTYFKKLLDLDDYDYLLYLQGWFQMKLDEENARLEAENKKPLEEANGTPVSFFN